MKIAVISPNKAHTEVIRRILQEEGALETWDVSLFEGRLEQLEPLAAQERPDLIIIDGLCHQTEDLGAVERLEQQYPTISIIILCQGAVQDFLLAALRMGVRDVLQLPLRAGELRVAVERIDQRRTKAGIINRNGKIIVFLSCKGGSGSTFLAANLAYVIGEHGKSVALLDLNLQFGDAALFVSDTQPEYTLSDVAGKNINRLDASFLKSSMVRVSTNYAILAAPEDPERALEIKSEHVEQLINLARSQYDYVILDIGQALNAISVKALDHADMIVPVLQESLPFIRGARRVLDTLYNLGHAKDKIYLVVNRHEKGGDIQLEDVERVLGMKVYKTVPNSYKAVTASVNQGVPIMKIAKKDTVTEALREMTAELIEGPKVKKGSWLSGFLHRS